VVKKTYFGSSRETYTINKKGFKGRVRGRPLEEEGKWTDREEEEDRIK
jgi:hypothetical protein